MRRQALSLLVENNPGVTSRISRLFSRRGFNIDSFSSGVTADPRYTRITIVASGDEQVLEQIEKHVTVHTGCRGIEVTGNGIICEDKGGARLLVPGSTVICALGQRPRSAEAEELMSCAPWAVCIGDCTRASTITNAVYQGYHAAYDI